jgi:hypothetical protein
MASWLAGFAYRFIDLVAYSFLIKAKAQQYIYHFTQSEVI